MYLLLCICNCRYMNIVAEYLANQWHHHVNITPAIILQILHICSKAKHCGAGVQTFSQALRHADFASAIKIPGTAAVWHPQKDIDTIEKTQYFTARICTKNWNSGYYNLLDILDIPELPPLAQCRLHTCLHFTYKIVHGLLCFPHNVVVPMWCTSSLMGGCGLSHECKTLRAENPTELGIW